MNRKRLHYICGLTLAILLLNVLTIKAQDDAAEQKRRVELDRITNDYDKKVLTQDEAKKKLRSKLRCTTFEENVCYGWAENNIGFPKGLQILKVRLKDNNAKGALFNDVTLTFNKEGTFADGFITINAKKLTIKVGNKKLELKDLETDADGWHVYALEKPMYMGSNSSAPCAIKNVQFWVDCGLGEAFDALEKENDEMSAEEASLLAQLFESGDLQCVGLSGKIQTDAKRAAEWTNRAAEIKAKIEQELRAAKEKVEAEYQQAKQEKEQLQKEIEEAQKDLTANYGLTNDENGKQFMEAFTSYKNGYEGACAIVGYYFSEGMGVKKNAAKAIEYLTEALKSSKNDDIYFGRMFMANMLWTGSGIAKNQPLAGKYYAQSVDYSGWWSNVYKMDYAKNVALAYCRVGICLEEGLTGTKQIDGAIKAYSECVSNGVYDETTAYAICRLAYYVETGRHRPELLVNRYVPNIKLARSYYHDALEYGDAKTKKVADQALKRIGY